MKSDREGLVAYKNSPTSECLVSRLPQSYLCVVDDGFGYERMDLVLSFGRHCGDLGRRIRGG